MDTWILHQVLLPESLCILGQVSYPLWAFPYLSIQYEAGTCSQIAVTPESLILTIILYCQKDESNQSVQGVQSVSRALWTYAYIYVLKLQS